MTPQIQDTYVSPVKSAMPQNVSTAKTSKTAATALSENSGYKETPTEYDDYMRLKQMSSESKSFLVQKPKQSDLLSQSSLGMGN